MKRMKPLIILLLLPVIILLISYGLTKIFNIARPGGSGFDVNVDRNIVFPWEDQVITRFHLDFSREKGINKPLGKTNILLVLDNSPSMNEMSGVRTRFEIAKEVTADFVDNFNVGSNVRMGVIFFGSGVTNRIPLTGDIPRLREMLISYRDMGNGTNFAPPLELAAQWLENCKNEANYIVFLTDGEADPAEPNRIYRQYLRENGVDVFMVGVGEGAFFHVLREIIKDENGNFDPNRILTCDDPLKLQILFDQVGEEIGNVVGRQGEMIVPFADKVFDWNKEISPKTKEKYPEGRFIEPPKIKENPLNLPYLIVFARKYIVHMSIIPTDGGIIKPLYDNLQFRYLDLENKPRHLKSTRAPYILNISYATLFWLFLPALLYLLFSILGRKKQEILQPEIIVFPYKKLETPGVLPLQFVHEKANMEWVPTLVIGLGRTGRHVITHLKQNLADTVGEGEKSIQLLGIDVAASEVDGPQPDRVPGTVIQLDRESEIYIPDPHLRNVKDKIEEYKNTTELNAKNPYSSLSLGECTTIPENIMGLSSGSERHATLVRAYFFKELEQGDTSKLLALLKSKLQQLCRQSVHSDFMQIVLVGNTNGGVGSGLITPLTVLLRRWIEKIKDPQKSAEINLLPVEDRQNHHEPGIVPIRNRVLLDELDLFSQAGRVSFPYYLVPDGVEDKEGILRGEVECRPYNNVYVFALDTPQPELNLYPQVSDSMLLFIERTARKESRDLVEGLKKKEGTLRKKEKIEVFSHVASRSLLYPAGLIKETLKLYFINDIFSEKIALPGLTLDDGTPVIERRGTLADLLGHSLIKPILKVDLAGETNKWIALLTDRDIRPFQTSLAGDTENFWSFLEKAIPLLLNHGVFSLTGLLKVMEEMQEKLRQPRSSILQDREVKEIQKTITFLERTAETLHDWIQLLLGTKETPGLLGSLQSKIKRVEIIKKELLSMKKSRVVLGLDKNTPEAYQCDNLRMQWISRWLGVEDQNQVYPGLQKRCLWKIVERGVARPHLVFEFFADKQYTFHITHEFKKEFMEKTHEVAEQFLINLKEITILELLLEYEKKAPETYGKPALAKNLYKGFETENLFYLYLLPHGSCIRLNPREETYMEQLKKEIENTMRVEEVPWYPHSSNQFRLFSLQVSTLLKGNYRDPRDQFQPLHMTETLKKETQKMFEKKFGINVPPLLAFHYLVFYYTDHFKSFINQWLGDKITRDNYDGLWKIRLNDQTHQLTAFKDEGLEEAAVRYVMNFDQLPLTPPNVSPANERLQQLEDEAHRRNPIFCWMKLYMEKDQ